MSNGVAERTAGGTRVAETDTNTITTTRDPKLWRDLVAYWFLGLCNNYGYVVMLSAAHDILEHFNEDTGHETRSFREDGSSEKRVCNMVSTGAILLADIIPSMLIKAVVPFLPFHIDVRAFIAITLQIFGFLMVAYANAVGQWLAILGVVLTSMSSGLGEASFLAYSSRFDKNVVSTWSSGTGGAGIIGAISYAGLIAIGLSSKDTMLVMIVVPVAEAIAFWVILRRPTTINYDALDAARASSSTAAIIDNETKHADDVEKPTTNIDDLPENERPLIGVREKLRFVPQLLKYIIPLTMVYFLEYLINQGLFELVFFENAGMDKATQYRWLQVDYQLGVFISRSSVNIITIDKIWLMAVFQAVNVVLMLSQVIWWFMPSIWIVFVIVFWEGLLGGGAYVNTFYRMSKELPEARRIFALGVVPVGDTVGIAVAGAIAIPLHNALCSLPRPY